MLPAALRFVRRAPWLVCLSLIMAPGVTVGAQLTLSWTDNATNESGYRVERKIGSGGSYAEIAVLGANSTGYTDPNVAASTSYCYRVRAFNTAGVSGYSNEVCKTTAQGTLNLTVTKSGTGSGTILSSPGGINCGSDCGEAFSSGAVVTLTATPSAGSRFDGWSGGGCAGTGPCTLSGNSSPMVSAQFTAQAAGPPSFTVTGATVSPNPVSRGAGSTITTSITNTGGPASGILVDLEIYDTGGRRVHQQFTTGQSFQSGQQKSFQWTWPVPAAQAPGVYTVKVGIFSAGWATLYTWDSDAAAVSVQTGGSLPSFTVTGTTVSPNPAPRGAGSTITTSIANTGGAASGILVDLEIYDAGGRRVHQQFITGQSFQSGQQKSFQWTWPVPAAQAPGVYTVKVGIFSAGWATLYTWHNGAFVTVP